MHKRIGGTAYPFWRIFNADFELRLGKMSSADFRGNRAISPSSVISACRNGEPAGEPLSV